MGRAEEGTYHRKVIAQLGRDIAIDALEGGGVTCCDAQDNNADDYGCYANKPHPGEAPVRGPVGRVDGHCVSLYERINARQGGND